MKILAWPFKAIWWLVTAEWMKYTTKSWRENKDWWNN